MPTLQGSHDFPPNLVARVYRFAQNVGWVSSPDCGRGTLDLLQSCMFTIFFATYTSLHLNIPNDGDGTRRVMWTRFCWMTATTLAPEVCMCVAVTQYLEARIVLRDLDELYYYWGYREGHGWKMVHAYYFNMKGFIFKPHKGRFRILKMKHLPGVVAADLLPLITKTEEMIKDYSKNDHLAKLLALVQAFWFLIQTFARMKEHLPTSPLEISTVAYIACTFFSYLLWWNKPQDVTVSTPVDHRFERFFHKRPHSHSPQRGIKSQLPNKNRPYRLRDKVILGFTFQFIATLFGGLHCLAWNYEFPTHEERLLWRISSVGMIALPPIFYWTRVMLSLDCFPGVPDVAGLFLICLYIVVRMFNLLEVFFSLRSTPPGLYRTVNWVEVIPHF